MSTKQALKLGMERRKEERKTLKQGRTKTLVP